MAKLLIGEDNPFVAAFLQEALREAGYELCGVAASAKETPCFAQLLAAFFGSHVNRTLKV